MKKYLEIGSNVRAIFDRRLEFQIFSVCLLALLGVLSYYLQFSADDLGLTNVIFVDGVSWLDLSYSLLAGTESIFDVRSSWLLFLVFCPVIYVLGTVGAVFVNAFFLGCVFSSNRVNQFFVFSLFFLFYFLSLLLPGKEVLSLFFTFLFSNALFSRRYVFALVVACLQFFVRDGSGLIFFVFALFFIFDFLSVAILLFLVFCFCFVDLYLLDIQDVLGLFIFERTIGFFSGGDAWQPYLLRLFANVTNLGARFSVWAVDGSFSVTGVALWFSGVGIFAATCASFYTLLVSKEKGSLIYFGSYFFLFAVVLSSVSPLIQPRYIIPFACSYLSFFHTKDKRLFLVFLVFLSFVLLFLLRMYYFYFLGLPDVESFYLDERFFFYR